jgi:ubiquinone/menaquinone biosynthesis C-methylase UbiE
MKMTLAIDKDRMASDALKLSTEAPAVVNANKALWEMGDFTRLAATMRDSGEDLVDVLGIHKGMRILDLGCGDGTTALPAAQRGADVLGVDIASNLVAAGSSRAQEAGLTTLRFQEGDASNLEAIEDDRFDLVISIFGAMFAPHPHATAKEMVRVTRPGGRIVMGNWIPGDPTLIARVLQTCASFTPPPPEGFVSPVMWGQEEIVRDRFEAAGIAAEKIFCERSTYTFRYDGSPSEFLAVFRNYYGPTMKAFQAAGQSGREVELQEKLEKLFESENRGQEGRTEIPASFLKVIVHK